MRWENKAMAGRQLISDPASRDNQRDVDEVRKSPEKRGEGDRGSGGGGEGKKKRESSF